MAKYFTFAPEAFKILETSTWKKQDASALIKTRWEWGVGGLAVPDNDPAFDLRRVEKNENDEWLNVVARFHKICKHAMKMNIKILINS